MNIFDSLASNQSFSAAVDPCPVLEVEAKAADVTASADPWPVHEQDPRPSPPDLPEQATRFRCESCNRYDIDHGVHWCFQGTHFVNIASMKPGTDYWCHSVKMIE